jgi:hypothetical protein
MSSVYIKGPEKALDVSTWIKSNLKNCEYEIDLYPPSTFSGKYRFSFKSKSDATMVALRWGNEYVGL